MEEPKKIGIYVEFNFKWILWLGVEECADKNTQVMQQKKETEI